MTVYVRLLIVVALLARASPAWAHGSGFDIRPQWLIDVIDSLRERRDRAHQDDFFEELYGRKTGELGALLTSESRCGQGGETLMRRVRELDVRVAKTGAVSFTEGADYDVFFGQSASSIAREAAEIWSFDACVAAKPRAITWTSRAGARLVTITERGDVVLGEGAQPLDPSEVNAIYESLVRAFPCRSDDDCVLLRTMCSSERQREAFASRSPLFERFHAATELERGRNDCAVAESPRYQAIRAACLDARCDIAR